MNSNDLDNLTNSELARDQGLLKKAIMPDKQTSRILCLILNASFCVLLYNAKEFHVLILVVISTTILLLEPIGVYIGARAANAADVVDATIKMLRLVSCVDIVKDTLFFLSTMFSIYVLLPNVICLL